MTPEAKIGDYVMVHLWWSYQRPRDEEEARRTFDYLLQMGEGTEQSEMWLVPAADAIPR